MNKEELLLQLIDYREDDQTLLAKVEELFEPQSVERKLAEACFKERREQYSLLLKQAAALLSK